MSDRALPLLLGLALTFQDVCAVFRVWTLLQYNFEDNNSVKIICQHDAPKDWTMGASLLINGTDACKKDNEPCEKEEGNQFNFTLKFPAEHKRLLCQCLVYRIKPLPVIERKGDIVELLPGCSVPCVTPAMPESKSCNCSDVVTHSPQPDLVNLLTWALLGIVLLLCLYSLIITVAYIKLRIKISDELTITYVPMQHNGIRSKKKAKEHGADKNAEYMDMREVHHHTQPIRDLNHNSRLNPVGSNI